MGQLVTTMLLVKLEKKQAFYRKVAGLAERFIKKICASDRYLEISEVRIYCGRLRYPGQFSHSQAFYGMDNGFKNAELLDQGLMLRIIGCIPIFPVNPE